MGIEAPWTHLIWIWQYELPAQMLINTDFLKFKVDFEKKCFFFIYVCSKSLHLMVA